MRLLILINTNFHFEEISSLIAIFSDAGLDVSISPIDPKRKAILEREAKRPISCSASAKGFDFCLLLTYYHLANNPYNWDCLGKTEFPPEKLILLTHRFGADRPLQCKAFAVLADHVARHATTLHPLTLIMTRSGAAQPKRTPPARGRVLLIQGNLSTARRNYSLVPQILQLIQRIDPSARLVLLGKRGDYQPIQHPCLSILSNCDESQFRVEIGKADFLLPLIDQTYANDYYAGCYTTTMGWALGLGTPVICEQKLATLYGLEEGVHGFLYEQTIHQAIERALGCSCDQLQAMQSAVLDRAISQHAKSVSTVRQLFNLF